MKFNAPIVVIFTTVFVDLVGFGIVIPLVNLYGKHFGASPWELAALGGIYSLMQFLFSPFWGSLSDRIGRRPVLLVSLFGSTLSYLIFAFADTVLLLILSRALGGIFAANIAAAQAYIADITPKEKRAQGMGLIGAAFGLGFTIGPAIGGIAAKHFGLHAPGVFAAVLCGANLILAIFRLKESLPKESRNAARRATLLPLPPHAIAILRNSALLTLLISIFFLVIFSFSNFEQTFALLIQHRFDFSTVEASYRAGLALMWLGIVGVFVQGFLIRWLVPRFGELRLVFLGLVLFASMILAFPFAPTYGSLYVVGVLFAFGSGIMNPSLAALISKNAPATEQGTVLGITQGMGSLARTVGPPVALLSFSSWHVAPFIIASLFGWLAFSLALQIPSKLQGKESQ